MENKQMTARQKFYLAQRRNADATRQFLDMATGPHGITDDELKALINKRPALWKRFEGYAGSLPL